ncbi:MAG: FeoA domain-containing protein [Desulfovibrio sp.]|uniref:FeoA domain-containing protein n=1 Tax=Desulfovibrio sp. 7SRBS1 TaxID=3378064 RepID=UPI003B41EA13
MLMLLDEAPYGVHLVLSQMDTPHLADRFARMGLHPGDIIIRLDEEVEPGPVRVRGPLGEVILAAGMASKVIAHHDDDHKTPIMEMHPGEHGHVEGLVCGSGLEKGLAILGLRENDRVEMLRRLPPMQYEALVKGHTVRLTEGTAAKIWGECGGKRLQFAMAGTGRPFKVLKLLGGHRAVTLLQGEGINEGDTITLVRVSPARSLGNGGQNHSVIQSSSGLRIYLRPEQTRTIWVAPE